MVSVTAAEARFFSPPPPNKRANKHTRIFPQKERKKVEEAIWGWCHSSLPLKDCSQRARHSNK
jgi:hypothetical protein